MSALNPLLNQDATTTVVTSSANPSVHGHSVTFTAAVTAAAPGSGTPSGTVTFKDGSTTLGTVTLASGKATFKTASLSKGSHTITAAYGGDGNFTTSTSAGPKPGREPGRDDHGRHLVGQPLGPRAVGDVHGHGESGIAGSGTPTGTVTFMDGSTTLRTRTLTGGVATFTTSSLPIGTHPIKVVYGGDTNFKSSTSAVLNQVVQA